MKGQKRNLINSQSGQGSIEYIMILLIVVIVALSALYQFNTAFSSFAQNYFGEYLACLLETGELPNLGADSGTNCDSEFEEFSLENGRRRNVEQVPIAAVEGDPGPGASVGAGTVAQTSRNRGRPSRLRTSGARRVGGGAKAAKEKQDGSGAAKKSELTAPDARVRSFSNSRIGPRKIAAQGVSVAQLQDKKEKALREKNAAEVEDDNSGRDRKLRIKKNNKKVELEEGESMTFGKFIKYLLIIGMIIAIVVFLGGQILQASKDSE